jgi:hypothetical protein
MNIGGISSGIGNKNTTQLGFDFKEHLPTGQLDDIKGNSFHLPFARQTIYTEKRINYPVIPEIAGHYHTKDYKLQPLNQINPTVAVFNDLYNFNPTHKEMSFFEPHATDKLIHHNESRPREEREYVYDMRIPNEIDTVRKDNAPDAHRLLEHSFSLVKRRRK